MGEGSAMPTDPHHTPIITQPLSSQSQRKQKSRRPKEKDTQVPQSSVPSDTINVADEVVNEEPSMQLKELMDFCTKLQQRVLDLENTKIAQAQEITSLKNRVKKLEKKGGSRTHKLKRLYKVGRSARIVSSDKASLGDQEDASKQGRKIHDIDADEDITLENVHDAEMFDVNDLHGDEVFVEKEVPIEEVVKLKSAKPTTAASTRPKSKGLVIHEEEQIEAGQLLAERLQAREQEELTIEERAKLFQQLLEKRRKFFAAKRAEEKRNRPPTRAQQRKLAFKQQAEEEEEQRLAREKVEANVALTKEWNDIQAKIKADQLLAKRLTELVEGTEMEESSKKAEVMEESSKTAEGSETREESSLKRAGDELEQENAKKQKMDDD
ncbi:hypothetical protein Tco_1152378 [Tanacetum coccineum]